MQYKFKKSDRVRLIEDGSLGRIYDVVPRNVVDDPNYYYVQWDKNGLYIYEEDMLEPEPKGK